MKHQTRNSGPSNGQVTSNSAGGAASTGSGRATHTKRPASSRFAKFSTTSDKISTKKAARRNAAPVALAPAPKRPVAQPKWVRERLDNKPDALAAAAYETLEGRQLMSASMHVADGILMVNADQNTASRMI